MFTDKLLIMKEYIGKRCYIMVSILAWISLFAISCENIKTNDLIVNSSDFNTILPSISQKTSYPIQTKNTDFNDTTQIPMTSLFISPSIQAEKTNTPTPIINNNADIIVNIKTNSIVFYIKGNKQGSNHYLKYTLKHIVSSKNKGINADLWRLYEVYDVRKTGSNKFSNSLGPIINAGEWECAIAEKGCDFIGGYHGNELVDEVSLTIDNKPYTISNKNLFECRSIVFKQQSILISRKTDKPIVHRLVEYDINSDRILIKQQIEWLSDAEISKSYLAMLPIVRKIENIQITDSAYSDIDNTIYDISKPNLNLKINTPNHGIKQLTVYGSKSGFNVSVKVDKTPNLSNSNAFVSNAQQYNKIYFDFSGPYTASCGELWDICAEYQITNAR
jgi:uncharacterized membrane protein